MFKGTMTKWPVQKLAQGTTQKFLQDIYFSINIIFHLFKLVEWLSPCLHVCYSAWKRLVQKWMTRGSPLSDHRFLNILNNYSKHNKNQALAMSDILSNANIKKN